MCPLSVKRYYFSLFVDCIIQNIVSYCSIKTDVFFVFNSFAYFCFVFLNLKAFFLTFHAF